MDIFDASGFVPRTHCGNWSAGLAFLSQASDLAVAVAYFAIPTSLGILWRKRRGLPGVWVVLLFVAFITLCGLSHVCQALAFHWPAYRLFVLVTALTGLVSLVTAGVLPWQVYRYLDTPTAAQILNEAAGEKTELLTRLHQAEARQANLRNELEAERTLTAGLSECLGSLKDYQTLEMALASGKVTEMMRRLNRLGPAGGGAGGGSHGARGGDDQGGLQVDHRRPGETP
jgi:hypothetical protein